MMKKKGYKNGGKMMKKGYKGGGKTEFLDLTGVGTKSPPTKDEADAIKKKLREGRGQEFKKKGGGMLKKKGYAMGGAMKKKGMKKGGKVRGAGIARKGVRPAKMR